MTPTPGQICYEAYCAGLTWRVPWPDVAERQQQRWEAAAQAVLADALRRVMPPTGTLTPLQWVEAMRRLVGQYWAGVDVDAYVASVRGDDAP